MWRCMLEKLEIDMKGLLVRIQYSNFSSRQKPLVEMPKCHIVCIGQNSLYNSDMIHNTISGNAI